MTALDYLIVAGYLGLTISLGLSSRGRQKSDQDIFTGSGLLRGPLWSLMLGCSIAASFFSGISFLAVPSVAYQHGAMLAMGVIIYPVGIVVVNYWFLPRYMATGSEAPYDFIERKFGRRVRILVSAGYLVMRVSWMGTLLYAPTLLLMTVTGWGPDGFWPLVLIMGSISTLYAVLGGIRGVVVTDAIQFFIILAGIAGIAYFALAALPIPMTQATGELAQRWSETWVDVSLNPQSTFSIWAVLSGMMLTHLSLTMADQMSLQRYLATGNLCDSRKAKIYAGLGGTINLLLLVLVGLSIWVWHQHVQDPNLPGDADQVLPYFLTNYLPHGMTGCLVAALLAATVSSMSSGVNVVACSLMEDFSGAKRKAARDPSRALRHSRWISLLVGILATGVAGVVGNLGSIFNISHIIMGTLYGPVLACVVAVFLLPRAPAWSVAAGILLGVLAGVAVSLLGWSSLLVCPASFLIGFLVPWIAQVGRRCE